MGSNLIVSARYGGENKGIRLHGRKNILILYSSDLYRNKFILF
jgi:hypothetical protein